MHQHHAVLTVCIGIVASLAYMAIVCRQKQPKRSWPELVGKPVGEAQYSIHQETQGMQHGFMHQDNMLLNIDTDTAALGNKVKGTFNDEGLLIDVPELVDGQ